MYPSRLITFMITSIIASVFVVPLIFIDAIGISNSSHSLTYIVRHHYNDGFYDPTELCLWIFQSLIGLAQAAIAITTAAFSCRVVCCGSKTAASTGIVLYNPAVHTNGPFTVLPQNDISLVLFQQQQCNTTSPNDC